MWNMQLESVFLFLWKKPYLRQGENQNNKLFILLITSAAFRAKNSATACRVHTREGNFSQSTLMSKTTALATRLEEIWDCDITNVRLRKLYFLQTQPGICRKVSRGPARGTCRPWAPAWGRTSSSFRPFSRRQSRGQSTRNRGRAARVSVSLMDTYGIWSAQFVFYCCLRHFGILVLPPDRLDVGVGLREEKSIETRFPDQSAFYSTWTKQWLWMALASLRFLGCSRFTLSSFPSSSSSSSFLFFPLPSASSLNSNRALK